MRRKETILYEKLDGKRVRCGICQRRCIIASGDWGYCSTRKNEDGILYSLIYGEVSTWRVAPSEIKPLFHFLPGGKFFSLGSVGCNFRCPGCQNWDIAHVSLENAEEVSTQYLSPEKACKLAESYGCDGISWTYNEPTLWFEYTLDTAKRAKDLGLATNYVTNGFITAKALDLIGQYLDAFRVDVKGLTANTYRRIANINEYLGILMVTERAKKKWNMWVEVVTNVIPGYNDDPEELRSIARWISHRLGADTPWHLTRFIPHFKLSHLEPTPLSTLEHARELGYREGLKFVYLGNVPGHQAENTYCPKCGRSIIKRHNYTILEFNLKNGKCKFCGEPIPIRLKV